MHLKASCGAEIELKHSKVPGGIRVLGVRWPTTANTLRASVARGSLRAADTINPWQAYCVTYYMHRPVCSLGSRNCIWSHLRRVSVQPSLSCSLTALSAALGVYEMTLRFVSLNESWPYSSLFVRRRRHVSAEHGRASNHVLGDWEQWPLQFLSAWC